jgi:hypothetical protein
MNVTIGNSVVNNLIYSGIPSGDLYQEVGVSTDPTNSGIETSDSDLYLYFYVGETVQNANLINAGRIEEKIADIKSDVDKINSGSKNPAYSRFIQIPNDYTCPSDGYVVLQTVVAENNVPPEFYINGLLLSHFHNVSGTNVRWGGGMYKVSKGDFLHWEYWDVVLFIPEKGV